MIEGTGIKNNAKLFFKCIVLMVAVFFIPDLVLPLGLIYIIYCYFSKDGKDFLRSVGFRKQDSRLKTLGLAIMWWLVVAGITYIASEVLGMVVPIGEAENPFGSVEGNIGMYVITLLSAVVLGGIVEEVIFRGYLLTRFESIFGSSKYTIAIIIFITSLVFGALHWNQGIAACIMITLGSILYGYIFYHSNKNLWLVILIHALQNAIAITLLYLGM